MIPVFEPLIEADEIAYVTDALRKGEISGNFGTYLDQFEKEFSSYVGCKHGIAVSSGTAALHLATDVAGIGPGDEVLISSSTNIATALGVVHNGGIPIPVDSEDSTWNLNLDLLEKLITPKTKAIIPVHLFGHPVDMDRLMNIANKYKLVVIEDCAESHGASVRGRQTGSFGQMACFSFYANKVITTGEGGMIVTNDDEIADRVRLLRNLAFTLPRFQHEYAGYNFRMTGYQAAMGLAQVRKLDRIVTEKRRVAATYNKLLKDIYNLQLPVELEWAQNVYWMYGIKLRNSFPITRDQLSDKLRKAGIETRTFFCPMNQQPCLIKIEGFRPEPCPVADDLWKNGLYLPSACTLKDSEIEYVCGEIITASGV